MKRYDNSYVLPADQLDEAIYLVSEVDQLLTQATVWANNAAAADSPTARKQALHELIKVLQTR